MKTASLSGSLRESVGKKDADALRANNQIPGVLYGGAEQIHFSVSENQINKVVFNPDVFKIDLDIAGKKVECIIQDIQFHPVTDRVTHLDFLEILPGKPVKMDIPLRTTGQAVGVLNGGRLEVNYRRIPVRGIADALPESLSVDISDLDIGDNARVRDLTVDGLEILLSESALLVACKRTRAAMSAESDLEGEEGEGGEGGEGSSGGEGGEGGEGSSGGEGGEA
tara:strand:- start:4001 stop:4672 length:672 start_codon:yes stop_codon:yes gene_type:complete